MGKLSGKQIREMALKLIAERPEGIKYRQLMDAIAEASPETPANTISGSIWDLDAQFPKLVHKPDRGLYQSVHNGGRQPSVTITTAPHDTPTRNLQEEDFYLPVSEFLKGELNEAKEVMGDIAEAIAKCARGGPRALTESGDSHG